MQLNMVRQHPLAANRKGCFLGLHPIFVSNSFIPALWLSLAVTGRRELWGSSEFLQQNIQAVWARVWNLQRWMWEASRLDAVAVLIVCSMTLWLIRIACFQVAWNLQVRISLRVQNLDYLWKDFYRAPKKPWHCILLWSTWDVTKPSQKPPNPKMKIELDMKVTNMQHNFPGPSYEKENSKENCGGSWTVANFVYRFPFSRSASGMSWIQFFCSFFKLSYFLACFEVVWCSEVVTEDVLLCRVFVYCGILHSLKDQ